MKAKEIQVGGQYIAKVSGRLVPVRVDEINEVQRFAHSDYSGKSTYVAKTVYAVTNLTTNRKTVFRSAAKFRSVVK